MARKFSPEDAFSWAASRCSLRECCRNDIMTKLLEKGLSLSDAENVLDKLTDENYINEERYARAFVHDKTLYDRWGRIKTRQSLRMKGIDRDNIENAISLINEEEYVATLRILLEQKRKTIKAENDYDMRQKLVRFAAGRGFEPDIVFSVIEDIA